MRPVINELFAITDKGKVSELTRNWTYEIWQEARLETQIHGIAPLLYCSYSDKGVLNFLDQSFRDYLSGQYQLNRNRIQRIQKVLHSILYELDINGVAVMPLKGSVLINEYYSNPAIRPMADIDLLIYKSDENKTEKILASLGYYLSRVTSKHKVYTADEHISSMTGEHPDNPIAIEIYTEIYSSIGSEKYDITQQLFKTAEQGFQNYKSAMKPSRIMLLIHLFFHASDNQNNGILRAIQLYDISIITESIEVKEWVLLLKIIEVLEGEKLIYSTLAINDSPIKIPIPDFVADKLRMKTPKSLIKLINSYSLDAFISSNKLHTLLYLSREFKNTFYKKVLSITNLCLLKLFIDSTQLEWYGSAKKKVYALLCLIKAHSGRLDNRGYFIGYSMTLMIFFLVLITKHNWLQKLREKFLTRLELFVFRNENVYK